MGADARDVGLLVDEDHRAHFVETVVTTNEPLLPEDHEIFWKVECIRTTSLGHRVDVIKIVVGDEIVASAVKIYVPFARSMPALRERPRDP
jgi:hypothetical protein